MVVCFTCGPETKAALDRLVASGHYPDHSAAITSAIDNLAVIHSELKGATSIVIDREAAASVGEMGKPSLERDIPTPSTTTPVMNDLTSRTIVGSGIPALLQYRQESAVPNRPFAKVDADRAPTSKSLSVDNWMFGQFNRLLPAKVTCRALATILAQDGDRQPLDKVAFDIANDAAKFGSYLTQLDERRNLGRDDAMAIAFPKGTAPSEHKSIQRFASQFVGATNKEGELSGLPYSLKLIGPHPEFKQGIALTEAGWNFSALSNPVLDGVAAPSTLKFSDEEINFLTQHVLHNVPVEALAYRTILNAVAEGVLTPDDLDVALAKLSGAKKVEKSFVSTQRSGAICRMADLDLIGRSRTGTRVSYVISPRGEEYREILNNRFSV